MEMRAVTKFLFFFFLQGKAPKEIHAILTETLGEHVPSYTTVKNWVAQFKRGDFSICDAPRPGRPTTVTTPEIIDQIHELILEDHRISAKSITEQLTIFRPTRRSLLPRRPGWTDNLPNFFLSGLQKLEQRAKKCIELRGEYVE